MTPLQYYIASPCDGIKILSGGILILAACLAGRLAGEYIVARADKDQPKAKRIRRGLWWVAVVVVVSLAGAILIPSTYSVMEMFRLGGAQ